MSRAELDLAARLADALAHLQRHRVREFVGLCVHERRRLGDDDRPLGIALVPPGLEAGRGGRELGFELLVGQLRRTSSAACPSAGLRL